MRMSCNGCRVLRKGCSEHCSIRPCLQWIKSPESQANATVFLAKFYGRAGLMNLINGGPENLRPAIFRSLLYEACGRIVNPIYGSVGLLWSGSWQLCQSAVESVLNGSAIIPISTESALSPSPPMKAYDIRHISKAENSAVSQELHKVKTSRNRFKRWGSKPKPKIDSVLPVGQDSDTWHRCYPDGFNRAASNDLSETATEPNGDGDSRETESVFSVETEEGTLVNRSVSEPVQKPGNKADYDSEVELELTLGFEPVSRKHGVCPMKGLSEMCGSDDDTWKMKLGF